jgi:hypothetical protein
VKVSGSHGRLQTLRRKLGDRGVTLTNVPAERTAARIVRAPGA